jgi:hypothetical protein
MAPAGKRIHIVKRPDKRDAAGEPVKQRSIVKKFRDPMQIENIARRHLEKRGSTELAAIIAKEFCAGWARFLIAPHVANQRISAHCAN